MRHSSILCGQCRSETAQKLLSQCSTELTGARTLVFMISITLEKPPGYPHASLQQLILFKNFFFFSLLAA